MRIYVEVYLEDEPDKQSKPYGVSQIIPNVQLRTFKGGSEFMFRGVMKKLTDKLILDGRILPESVGTEAGDLPKYIINARTDVASRDIAVLAKGDLLELEDGLLNQIFQTALAVPGSKGVQITIEEETEYGNRIYAETISGGRCTILSGPSQNL